MLAQGVGGYASALRWPSCTSIHSFRSPTSRPLLEANKQAETRSHNLLPPLRGGKQRGSPPGCGRPHSEAAAAARASIPVSVGTKEVGLLIGVLLLPPHRLPPRGGCSSSPQRRCCRRQETGGPGGGGGGAGRAKATGPGAAAQPFVPAGRPAGGRSGKGQQGGARQSRGSVGRQRQ